MSNIWKQVLRWINVEHDPQGWEQELEWMIHSSKNKSRRTRLLKTSFLETVYGCWLYRNEKVFNKEANNMNRYKKVYSEIVDSIIHRMWRNPKYRGKIAPFIL